MTATSNNSKITEFYGILSKLLYFFFLLPVTSVKKNL